MAAVKKIMRAFVFTGKTRYTVTLTQRAEPLVTPCQKLVRVALMAHVPDYGIFGAVKYPVKRNRQFYNAEIA
jgi:hypothetical protein